MNSKRKHLLQVNRFDILQDVDPKWIIDELVACEVITLDEATVVMKYEDRKDRITKLLDILPRHNNAAYDGFVDVLRKDYRWLAEKLELSEDNLMPPHVVESHISDSLGRGDVPRVPIHYVKRHELETLIHTKLKQLKRHQMLVLHGMPGSGKSSLAKSVLRDNPQLVLETFKGNVFWINVGDCYTEEQIITLQSRMRFKICSSESFQNSSTIDSMSEISLNSSVVTASTYEQKWTDYRDMLKSAFEIENFRDSLIIIDDLRLGIVAQAFDVGCKVMITTQDKSYLSEFHPEIINVSDSLTETESLHLIANCIDSTIEELPSQARKIHNLCKGSPLLMALLGGLMADNKERLKFDKNFWDYYVNRLKKKDSFFGMFRSTNQQKPYLAITMCIDSLQNKSLIDHLKSLAVLSDNVKVSTKALCTILNLSECDVENVMKQLKNKSLVIEYYNVDMKSYQYEIHDMIMSYLKSLYNESEMKKLHANLIYKYKDSCLDKNLVNLPDDGYMCYYIGYHLDKSGNLENIWNMFHELYTNLTFIGNKIRLAGPADVMDDFNKYSSHIIKKDTDNKFVTELRKFIHSYAYDLHWYPNTEIVQSILQHGQKGTLYDKAMNVAMHPDNRNNLYFEFSSENSLEEINYIPLDVRDTICVVKFWMDCILIGNATGKIIVWSLVLNKKVQTFHGHEGPIKSISLDYKSWNKMASIGEDGQLKIWVFKNETDSNGHDDVDSGEMDDPVEETFESFCTISLKREPFAGSYWGHVYDILLAHTEQGGSLIVYKPNGENCQEMKKVDDYSISCSVLSADDTLAICGYVINKCASTKYGIHIYVINTGDLIMSFLENDYVLSLAVIKDHPKCIMSLTKIHLNKHMWRHVVHTNVSQVRSAMSQTKIADLEVLKAEYTFQTGCVSEDGLYMFVSTTDGHVLVYSLKSNELVIELNNHRGKVTSIDSISHLDHLNPTHLYSLITKSGEDVHTLKYWYLLSSQLKPPSESQEKTKLTLKFDCVFDKHILDSPVVTDYHFSEYKSSPIRRTGTNADSLSSNNNSVKPIVQKTSSLDRHSIKPLNLKNISTLGLPCHPIIAVVNRKNTVQILKGKKCVIETPPTKSTITTVAVSGCGQYLIYGTKEGVVNLLLLKSRFPKKIMDLNDEIFYLEFVNSNLLVAASASGGLMIYEILGVEESFAKMVVKSGVELGSQELINDLGRRRNRSIDLTDYNSKHGSSSSPTSSLNSPPETNGNVIHRTYPSTESSLQQSVFVKCFWLEDVGLLSVACDGSVKRWNLDPRVLGIVIRKQLYFKVSCAALYKNSFMVLCDATGKFQIYSLISEKNNDLNGVLYDSNRMKSGIVCCAVSCDGRLLALGLESGAIALWHISSKSMITALQLHKNRVRCLKFSPGPSLSSDIMPLHPNSPFSSKAFNFSVGNCSTSPVQDTPETEKKPPLVLLSLAEQIAWWDITQVMNNKIDNKKRRNSRFGSIYQLLSPKTNSLMEFNTVSETELADSVVKSVSKMFEYNNNPMAQWERLWHGKRANRNSHKKEILSCIKLVGDEAHQVLVDEKFSKFVTVDQSGNLYVMNVMENSSGSSMQTNGNGNGNGFS